MDDILDCCLVLYIFQASPPPPHLEGATSSADMHYAGICPALVDAVWNMEQRTKHCHRLEGSWSKVKQPRSWGG